MNNNKYDIFISYRRIGGAQYARILQLMLQQRGYRVFLDYDELTDGVFSEKIKDAIQKAPVFMIVLSKESMARCANEDDWVRNEILLAIEQGKHIIPINPDNTFDGFPDAVPDKIKETIGSHQHSEINFGQTLGVTIDLMIRNRLVPTVGERDPQRHKDEDYDAAKETLRKIDAHNRFMKRLALVCVCLIIAIVLGTCYLFWKHQKKIDVQNKEIQELAELRSEIEKKHKDFDLKLNQNLTRTQINIIDTILTNMISIRPDTLWMSQYEFTVGQWYGIKGEPFDESKRYLPMNNVSFGDICMFLLDLKDKTNINFQLPSVEEWQYAAHGGIKGETTLYSGDDNVDTVAWYNANSGLQPHPSNGQQGKKPNGIDLYDMSGNVAELCNTPYDPTAEYILYTVCGGDYSSSASEVTVVSRRPFDINGSDNTVGFRIVIKK